MTTRNVNGQIYHLAYDAENHLVSVTGDATASFAYDADGNQVQATVDGVTTYYVNQSYEVKNEVVAIQKTGGGWPPVLFTWVSCVPPARDEPRPHSRQFIQAGNADRRRGDLVDSILRLHLPLICGVFPQQDRGCPLSS